MKILLACLFVIMSFTAQAETGVSRGVFTTDIVNKEPVSQLSEINSGVDRVYYFTELLGLKGHKITHRWEYNGQVLAAITFEVGADRWRTWSSKNMVSSWVGTWRVTVLDEGGNIIEQSEFEYIARKK